MKLRNLMPIPQETNKNAGKNVGKLLTGPVLVAVLLISLREYNTENHTEKSNHTETPLKPH